MKKIYKFWFVLLLIIPINVSAHPGRLDGNGCHTCRTNCASWGLRTGQYHCHNGSTSTKKKKVKKSSNNKIKSIKVNGKKIKLKNNMKYTTTANDVDITTVLSSSKAKVSIPNTNNLKEGNNNKKIVVTAENGKKRTYKLNIYKKSSNGNFKMKVNNQDVVFNENVSEIIKLSSNTKNIDIKYELEHKKAKINLKYDKKLKDGETIILFNVIAEDNSKKEYKLNIYKESSNTNLEMKVNDKEVIFNDNVSENIKFDNSISDVDITYKLESDKASIDLNYDKHINEGDNTISFIVTAEDNSKKEYVLKIYRESSDSSINLKINNKNLLFNKENNEKNIYFHNDVHELDIKYILGNTNSQAFLNYDKLIKEGSNIIRFSVEAENKDKEDYTLNVYRLTKEEEEILNIIRHMFSINIEVF